jgi:hypothetical protein
MTGTIAVLLAVCLVGGCSDNANERDGVADAGSDIAANDVLDGDNNSGDATDGRGQSDDADASGPLTADDYHDQRMELLDELLCERLYDCPNKIPMFLRLVGEGAYPRDRCPDMISEEILIPDPTGSVDAGRIEFDAEKAEACLADVRAAIEEDTCEVAVDSEACSQVYTPTIERGDSCAETSECVDDLYCDTSGSADSCSGICEPPKDRGAACDPSLDGVCGDLRCLGEEGSATCQQVETVAEGESCSSNLECEGGLTCDLEDDVCQPILYAEEGEECDSFRVICTASTQCIPRTDPETGERISRCEPVRTLGESCESSAFHCQADAYCNSDDECVKKADIGESCGREIGVVCRFLQDCVDGTCVDAFPGCYDQ